MPTDYPRARKQARQLKQSLLQMVNQQASAPTQIATVSDVSAQLSAGIVQATTNTGPVQVAGIPAYTVCPGSQIYVRQLGVRGLYIYDGLAGSYNNRLTSSGSIQTVTAIQPVATTNLIESNGTIITRNGFNLTASANFYVSFMFSMSGLPGAATSTTLIDLHFLNAGNTAFAGNLQINYLPTGQLQLLTNNWNTWTFNDTTTEYFAPRRTWWVYLQCGAGLAINAKQPASSKTWDFFSGSFTTTPPAATYGVTVLGDHTYNTPAPVGSWISKISLGYAATTQLPTKMLSADSQVPQDTACWLCTSGDTPTNGAYPALPQTASGAYITTGPF